METTFLGVLAGLIIGGLIAWLAARARFQRESAEKIAELEGSAKFAQGQADQLHARMARAEEETEKLGAALEEETKKRVEMETRLGEADRNIERQKELVTLMKTEMVETFKAHAASALETSNTNFLQLAKEHLGKIIEQTKGRLGEHYAAVEGTVRPLEEMLKRYEEGLKAIEKNRSESYGGLAQSIQSLSLMSEQLRKETNTLVTALQSPKPGGAWGQMSLKRAVELAGMAPYCDFYEEVSVTAESGRLRPDMVIRLPNGRTIIIDAKAPVKAYLAAVQSSSSDEDRAKAQAGYVSQVRVHMNSLCLKSYWEQFESTPEMVVMYLPGESFFSVALEIDPKLVEDGILKKVILATPTTLIALLRAIAFGWQQEQVAKGAREISRLGKELYERFAVVVEHFSRVGSGLNRAVESHNEAVRSLETRLIPSFRRFKELGVSSTKEVEDNLIEIQKTAKETKIQVE
ncbi:MAG: DNA recombination protein RmuC [Syntrophales bacterium]|nr:DNA recombination protein RmuC [Syntrophales bacterium]MDD5533263.1 DNA recombination protein RmuC [Syntrophales bacterium]